METATLSGPPRPVMVQPVQKSLSLPSYARASGEGIDHKLIFAALEQREKVRRKSKIFKEKEKTGTSRQNYFCLPLPSSKKCKETSLSSDTSCSSLEFQKPKCRNSPPKVNNVELPQNQNVVKRNQNFLMNQYMNKIDLNNNSDEGNGVPLSVIVGKVNCESIQRTIRMSRSTVCSSDSMERAERSSKSSTDSLSRKERLFAVKARVEAERERNLGNSSSDDEEVSLRITRHNSDGIIHRTVREVKAKSTKTEKRFRRRNPEEAAAKRATRKQHRSLYIQSSADLDNWKPPMVRSGSSLALQRDADEISKDFYNIENKQKCIISQSPYNNYFSDICSGEYRSRLVKPIVDKLEATGHPCREQMYKDQNSTSYQNQRNVVSPLSNAYLSNSFNSSSLEAIKKRFAITDSPIESPKMNIRGIPRAPTPPPRSPKSTEFVNRVYVHHQNGPNSNYSGEACSLERKRPPFNSKPPDLIAVNHSSSVESIKRDLINSRRKTCSHFPQIGIDEPHLERPKTPTINYQNKTHQYYPPRSPDSSQKSSMNSRKVKLSDSNAKIISLLDTQGKRWDELEMDSEKKFNSLDSKTPPPSDLNWTKWKVMPKKKFGYPCHITSMDNAQYAEDYRNHFKNVSETSSLSRCSPSLMDKLSRSEANLQRNHEAKFSPSQVRKNINSPSWRKDDSNFQFGSMNRQYANENLDNAMEELENVYKSLKDSCENLTTQTKNSCESLPRNANSVQTKISSANPREFIKNSFDELVSISDKFPISGRQENLKAEQFRPSPTTELQSGYSLNKALCIEELFGDLTLQLDIEQKLLEEARKKQATPNRGSPIPKQIPQQKSESTQSISFESNHCEGDTSNTNANLIDEPVVTDIRENIVEKKKYKAVRSLSENIAALMRNENLSETSNKHITTDKNENSVVNSNQSQTRDSNEQHIKIPCCEDEYSSKHLDPDGIWQIRVSMDPGKTPTNPPLSSKGTESQLRLHSALRKPNDNIVHKNASTASQNAKQISSVRCQDKTPSRLSENELEKLLSTLLSDLPDSPDIAKKVFSQTTEIETSNITTKGVSDYLNKGHFVQNMEADISPKSRTNAEKSSVRLHSAALNISGNGELDNNSNRNNNKSTPSSFIPVRIRSNPLRNTYKNTDDNVKLTPLHRNSAFLENQCAWIRGRGGVRRHSVGLDDFSDLSIYNKQSNSNQEKRPPAFCSPPAPFCSSDTTANCLSASNPADIQCQNEYIRTENKNIELDIHNSCNGGEKTLINFNQSFEKVKDKSFMRKSSLNRLEFVDQTCLPAIHTPLQKYKNVFSRQQSSSEACSDQERTKSPPESFSSNRRNSASKRGEKDNIVGICRQNSFQEKTQSDEKKMNWICYPRQRENSLKLRNRRSPKAAAAALHFKQKAYSAGEQESYPESSKINIKSKVCFSSQDLPSLKSKQDSQNEEKPLALRSISPKSSVFIPSKQTSMEYKKSASESDVANKPIATNCDNISSHDVTDETGGASGVSANRIKAPDVIEQIDADLFDCQNYVSATPLQPFPTDESFKDNEVTLPSLDDTAGRQLNNDGVLVLEVDAARASTPTDSDRESMSKRGSILRRKSEDRREIHGILKNADEKLFSRHFPSILKHRESSEEKDNWGQSDLHSILKKSTSEDESSTNSPDIRPILKNTSTDDESSSGFSSKPKPILKKRTSFSEECSYVSFSSHELKPILKKKSIMELTEEHPKPILKTRRKSEEAAATMSEFAIGSRPRAYSADRGVCKAGKSREDEDLT